jgi:hypothetical protein
LTHQGKRNENISGQIHLEIKLTKIMLKKIKNRSWDGIEKERKDYKIDKF